MSSLREIKDSSFSARDPDGDRPSRKAKGKSLGSGRPPYASGGAIECPNDRNGPLEHKDANGDRRIVY